MKQAGASAINASGHPLPKKLIESSIKRFFEVQQKLSSFRFKFLFIQNELKELELKNEKINDIGEGFNMLDYENLKTEAQAISTNIDLKQDQLEILRHQFLREKKQAEKFKKKRLEALSFINKEKSRLENLKAKESNLRQQITREKVQHEKLKQNYINLSLKTGLLSNNSLMRNFDKVSNEVQQTLKEIYEVEAFNSELLSSMEKLGKQKKNML